MEEGPWWRRRSGGGHMGRCLYLHLIAFGLAVSLFIPPLLAESTYSSKSASQTAESPGQMALGEGLNLLCGGSVIQQ